MKKPAASSQQPVARKSGIAFLLQATSYKLQAGFTLIETLVAISLVSVAIVAPMSLVSRSLASAFYARDQVTAYHLAQEGIEAVRAIRDGNILMLTLGQTLPCGEQNILCDIPRDQDFKVDARFSVPTQVAISCGGACPVLQTDGVLYGYGSGLTENTRFTRTLRAEYVAGSGDNEIRVESTVSWYNAARQQNSFTIYENMYRWIDDASR